MKILIVENETPIRKMIESISEDKSKNLHLISVDSAAEFRELLTTGKWDLIIADYQLKDGTAFDVFTGFSSYTPIPKILISSYVDTRIAEVGKDLGFTYFVPRPLHYEDLERIFDEIWHKDHETPKPASVELEMQKILSELHALDIKAGYMDRIIKMSTARTNTDAREICMHALELAKNITKSEAGFVAVFDFGSGQLVEMARIGFKPTKIELRVPIKNTPFEPILDKNEPYLYGKIREAFWPGMPDAEETTYIAAPVLMQGSPTGIICLTGCKISSMSQVLSLLNLLIEQLDIALENRAIRTSLETSMKETLIAMARILDARDPYTKNHSANVSKYGVKIAKELGLQPEQIEAIRVGGLMHDIGKCGIPDYTLLKPGRLNRREFEIMKMHPVIGYNVIQHMDLLDYEKMIVKYHHERWDGFGYPEGIKSCNLPIEVRIVCIADAIDAMTTHRCYRKARPLDFCIEQLESNAGSQFDPLLVEAAVALLESGKMLDKERLAQATDAVDNRIVNPLGGNKGNGKE